MKYVILTILFVFSLVYAGYYLYNVDKKEVSLSKDIVTERVENQITVPEYLTEEFWKNITPGQLEQKLKTIKNVNEVRPDNKESMLHMLIQYGQYPEMIKMLIKAGVDIHLQNHRVKPPPDKDLTGEDRLHALCFALYRIFQKDQLGIDFITEILKYNQESVNKYCISESRKFKPVLLAVGVRLPYEVIKLLLEKGADVNAYYQDYHKPEKKFSILMLASFFDEDLLATNYIDPKVIQLLIDHGADLGFKDWAGRTAFDYMKVNKEFTKTEIFKKISAQF